jgi:transaldolase
VHGTYDDARATMQQLADQGIFYDEVVETLEVEGVQKFEASWDELVEGVEVELGKARS